MADPSASPPTAVSARRTRGWGPGTPTGANLENDSPPTLGAACLEPARPLRRPDGTRVGREWAGATASLAKVDGPSGTERRSQHPATLNYASIIEP